MLVCRILTIVTISALLGIAPLAEAADTASANCNTLFNLPTNTLLRPVDTKILANPEVCSAYMFLISRYEIGPRSAPCIKTKEQGVLSLNPDFAVRVARMIQDMEAQLGGRNIVRSAYRPKACGGGIGHSHGCAVDIEWASAGGWRPASDNPNVRETQWVIANGGNAKYRLHHPFPHPPEWHHIEPMDRASCLAGRAIDPTVGGTQTSSPSSNFTNAIRQALGVSTQQPAATQPAVPSQPASASQSPIQAFQEPQTAPIGVSSQIDTTGGTPHTTSVADKLEELAFGTSSQQVPGKTGTTVPLVVSGRDAAGIISTQNQGVPQQTAPSGVSGISKQTFISGDLSWQSDQSPPQPPITGLEAWLITIKSTLVRILQYLQPFGGQVTNERNEFTY